jgi:hypothetical protein
MYSVGGPHRIIHAGNVTLLTAGFVTFDGFRDAGIITHVGYSLALPTLSEALL